MAFYALKYAQIQNQTLILLHIENKKDALDDVESSMNRISTLALSQNVQVERVILNGSPTKAIKKILSTTFADIIFCSTRRQNNFITDSFSELLIKMKLNVDIAVVRIVKMNYILDIKNIMLSITEDKLSVKKFTFFATLASSYKAKTEVFSVSSISKYKLSSINTHEVRDRLSDINYNLRHYLKLAHLMSFSIHIKHNFTQNESQSILGHIAKSNAELVIIGAKRLSVSSFFKREIPIEKIMRDVTTNTIAYYPKKD